MAAANLRYHPWTVSDFVEALFPDCTARDFIRSHLLASRLHVGHAPLERLARWIDLDAVATPAACAALGGGVFRSRSREFEDNWRPIALGDIPLAFDESWSVVVHDLREVVATERLLADLGLPLDTGVEVESWWTPAGAEAIDKHCDPEPRIVVQLAGQKHWQLEANRELPYPAVYQHASHELHPWNRPLASSETLNPAFDQPTLVTMRPGSACFVPQGCWHGTRAADELSGGLIIKLFCPRFLDLLLQQIEVLASEPRWRQPLAGAWSGRPEAESCRALVGQLLEQLQQRFPRNPEAMLSGSRGRPPVTPFVGREEDGGKPWTT